MTTDESPLLEPGPDELPDLSDRSVSSDDPDSSGGPDSPVKPERAEAAPAKPAAPLWFGLDRRLVAGAAAVVVVLVLFFGVLLGKARHDLDALRGELVALRGELHRSQAIHDRGAVLRMRADIQTLRQTLPADLSADVEAADAALRRVDERLRAMP